MEMDINTVNLYTWTCREHGAETWRIFSMTANTTTPEDVPREVDKTWRETSLEFKGQQNAVMLCRGVPLSLRPQYVLPLLLCRSRRVAWGLCLPQFHRCCDK